MIAQIKLAIAAVADAQPNGSSDWVLRQYGERYLWFESISLHHPVAPNWRNFVAPSRRATQRRCSVSNPCQRTPSN